MITTNSISELVALFSLSAFATRCRPRRACLAARGVIRSCAPRNRRRPRRRRLRLCVGRGLGVRVGRRRGPLPRRGSRAAVSAGLGGGLLGGASSAAGGLRRQRLSSARQRPRPAVASPRTSSRARRSGSPAASLGRSRGRAGELTLADAGAPADAAAQVVELRAPDVAAARHLDPLDLRRVHGKRSLDTHAERLLADGESLARAAALALDHDALEDLGTAPRALDDLEVDLHAVAGLEVGHACAAGRARGCR